MESAHAEAHAAGARARDAQEAAEKHAGTAIRQIEEERKALADELSQLRAHQRALEATRADELARAESREQHAIATADERVRAVCDEKDETIRRLRTQTAGLQADLHDARDELRATQQEILAFE